MSKLNSKKYKDLNIFYFEDENLRNAINVIDKNYTISEVIKDTKRNYVALIENEGKKYI